MKTVKLEPISMTVETVRFLISSKEFDALTLYVAYYLITVSQKNYFIKATSQFMMKQLGWGREKFSKAKNFLLKNNLIEDKKTLVIVRHIVENEDEKNHPTGLPQGGSSHSVDFQTSSAYNNKVPTIKVKCSVAEQQEVFSLSETLDRWRKDGKREFEILADFIELKNLKPNSKEKLQAIVNRHIRSAKKLVKAGWSDEELIKAFQKSKKSTDEWTLDTIEKYLTK